MRHRILRWLAPILILAVFCLPTLAQIERPKMTADDWKRTESSESGPKAFAFPYAVAFLSTLLVMVILCTPARKR